MVPEVVPVQAVVAQVEGTAATKQLATNIRIVA